MFSAFINRTVWNKPYYVSKLDSALLVQVTPKAVWYKTYHAIAEDILDHLNAFSQPHFVILDLTSTIPNIEDIVFSFNAYTRGSNAWINHPNLKELLILTSDPSENQETANQTKDFQFGDLRIRVFPELDSALCCINQLQ